MYKFNIVIVSDYLYSVKRIQSFPSYLVINNDNNIENIFYSLNDLEKYLSE